MLTHSVGKLKVLVHGPLTSRSGMLMNNNAGMLEEKGSRNEQALATSRTAASVPASQVEAKQAKEAKQEAEAKQVFPKSGLMMVALCLGAAIMFAIWLFLR